MSQEAGGEGHMAAAAAAPAAAVGQVGVTGGDQGGGKRFNPETDFTIETPTVVSMTGGR